MRKPRTEETLFTVRGELMSTAPNFDLVEGDAGKLRADLTANFIKTKYEIEDEGKLLGALVFPAVAFKKTLSLTVGDDAYVADGGVFKGVFQCKKADGAVVLEIAKELSIRDTFLVKTTDALPLEVRAPVGGRDSFALLRHHSDRQRMGLPCEGLRSPRYSLCARSSACVDSGRAPSSGQPVAPTTVGEPYVGPGPHPRPRRAVHDRYRARHPRSLSRPAWRSAGARRAARSLSKRRGQWIHHGRPHPTRAPSVATFHPTFVSVAVGANDIVQGRSLDAYRANVRRILTQ